MLQSLIIYLMSTKEKEKVSRRKQGQIYSRLGLQDPVSQMGLACLRRLHLASQVWKGPGCAAVITKSHRPRRGDRANHPRL